MKEHLAVEVIWDMDGTVSVLAQEHVLVVRSKQRDPNPKDDSLIGKVTSTCKGFHYTFAALYSSSGVVRVRVPFFATQVASSSTARPVRQPAGGAAAPTRRGDGAAPGLPALLPDWEAVTDGASQRTFYYNRRTQQSSWERPAVAPSQPPPPPSMPPKAASVPAPASSAPMSRGAVPCKAPPPRVPPATATATATATASAPQAEAQRLAAKLQDSGVVPDQAAAAAPAAPPALDAPRTLVWISDQAFI